MRKKTIWLRVLPVIWMCVIFAFSHQQGQDSSQLSGNVTDIIGNMLSALGIDLTDQALHHIIRKTAHFTLFFILGLLCYFAGYANNRSAGRSAAEAVLTGIGYAFLDEFHQSFVPGRSSQLADVLIDSSGVVTAVFLSFPAAALGRRTIKKRQ